jgi:nucleotide-binding universal stress UspA family protein
MFTRIVIANDGSEGGFKALALGCDLAKHYGAALHMISVEELPDFPASIDEIVEIKDAEDHKYHDVIERARAAAAASGVARHRSARRPCRGLRGRARQGAQRRSSGRRLHGTLRAL